MLLLLYAYTTVLILINVKQILDIIFQYGIMELSKEMINFKKHREDF